MFGKRIKLLHYVQDALVQVVLWVSAILIALMVALLVGAIGYVAFRIIECC